MGQPRAHDLSQSQESKEDMGEREGEISIRSDIREEREKERSGNERRK